MTKLIALDDAPGPFQFLPDPRSLKSALFSTASTAPLSNSSTLLSEWLRCENTTVWTLPNCALSDTEWCTLIVPASTTQLIVRRHDIQFQHAATGQSTWSGDRKLLEQQRKLFDSAIIYASSGYLERNGLQSNSEVSNLSSILHY